ncbi:MAG: hypothetical protein JWL63_1426 [Rhodocyclales bacterium]|nr:hypothetical protein [Rhodocyclales bacterium]
MVHLMTTNALSFESDIRRLVARGDLDGALAFIRFMVDHVRFDPAAMGVTLGSPALDRLCGEIGAATLAQARHDARAEPPSQPADIIILATELYPLGGHSRVVADMIATRPDKRHLVLLSNFFESADRRAAETMVTNVASDSVRLAIAPMPGRLDKLLWLQTELARHPEAEVFVFNHHGDAAVIAAIQPGLNRDVIFCHHADYHLCLGAHLPWTRHIDFFAPCHHRCSEAGIVAEYWPLSVPDRGARSHDAGSFGQGEKLISCTSGVWSKFDEAYAFHYADVVVDILATTGGKHVHIGGIPDEAFARIHAGLNGRGIAPVRFKHLPQVPSVWDALLTNQVDLYISSFPLGGGRAITEALGAGIPLITHRHHLEPLLGACGLGPADTWNWSTPAELLSILAGLSTEELARRSREARQHYLQHHAPDIFRKCMQTGESPPLPAHIPQAGDRLASYLLRSTVRSESHARVLDELHKRVEALDAARPAEPAAAVKNSAPSGLTRAIAFYDNGDFIEAAAAFTELHEQQPAEPLILLHLGLIALRSGMQEDAGVFFDHAVACSQDAANTQAAIGQRCLALGALELAAIYLEAAIRAEPSLVGALALLTDALQQQGHTQRALALLKPLLQEKTPPAEILQRVVHLAAAAGDADTELAACLLARSQPGYHSRALQLMGQRDVAASVLLDESRRFVAAHASAPHATLPAGSRTRLRVGFVVGYIAANEVAQGLEPLLCDLDAKRFDTLLFFDEIRDATTAQRLALIVDESHGFSGMNAEATKQLIQTRRVDVLVNFEWHNHLRALMIFALRAAPVQINFSQPARSSALSNMDYAVADIGDAAAFTERILPLPDSADTTAYARNVGELLLTAWQQSGGTLEART